MTSQYFNRRYERGGINNERDIIVNSYDHRDLTALFQAITTVLCVKKICGNLAKLTKILNRGINEIANFFMMKFP